MILSDKQFIVSKAELVRLKTALTVVSSREAEQDWLKQVEVDAIGSQIADIESEVVEYELLKSGQLSLSKIYSLEDLPRILVQARIAANMSQTDLAAKLNMKPQQVQRYESTNYMGASLARLIEVSRVLGVKATGTFDKANPAGASVFVWSDADDIVWSQFPIKEMTKRKWFDVPRTANPVEKVRDYFLNAAGPQFATALHRKKIRSGNAPNEYALLAWQARVLERARELSVHSHIPEFKMDDSWLPELINLTRRSDGVTRAMQLLLDKGITLIIEPHLPGSFLDGAAMLSDSDRPVIGLTLRYDRLDNFWFVLLHELGHVFLHLFNGLRYDFFDEEETSDNDIVEVQADNFALNALIPEDLWDQCLSRFALSEESVLIDAETIGVDPSIIAGRIRTERRNYSILNNLVGQGQVRKQFEEVNDDLE